VLKHKHSLLSEQIMLERIFKHFKKWLKCFQAQALKCLAHVWLTLLCLQVWKWHLHIFAVINLEGKHLCFQKCLQSASST